MSSTDPYTELLVQQEGAAVQVTLNRPEALNALSLEMIRCFSAGLRGWAADPGVQAVFVNGAGERAFCAGGDIKSAYTTGMAYRRGDADESVISLFYGEEYQFNRQLFHFGKPVVAFMDGITMGGGFGVAGPCRFRIASEKTVFAMPEVGIGFFPDVGSVWFLSRAPGLCGAFLALTGGGIGPEDALYGGFATHFIPSAKHQECRAALRKALAAAGGQNPAAVVAEVLARYHVPPAQQGSMQKNQAAIDRAFDAPKVEKIIENLKRAADPWSRQQAGIIETRSPVSLKVALQHLRTGRDCDFDEITARDFVLARNFMKGHDFYEGVRAALIDKDKQPEWEPAQLADVTPAMVEGYFVSAGLRLDEIAA